MTDRELMQMVLEALESYGAMTTEVYDAIAALRERLTRQEWCKGDPGECKFNEGCMYACDKPAQQEQEQACVGWDTKTDTPIYAPSPAIPEGYALVPVEPTEAMLKAAAEYDWKNPEDPTWAGIYGVMIAAAQKEKNT